MTINYAERVARGAALLDEKWPEWRDQVDLGRLDIAGGYTCMTAQYAQVRGMDRDRNWIDGRHMLGLNDTEYVEHGFNATSEPEDLQVGEPPFDVAIKQLNDLWRDIIVQHRYAPEPRPEGEVPA